MGVMDVNQNLKDAENGLRDFVAMILEDKYGKDWINKIRVNRDDLAKWNQRKKNEEKRLGSPSDERLLYFADLYHIKEILKSNWSNVPEFKEALGEKKEITYWINHLEGFRNLDAHRRELLPHQQHLVLGISGEIRTRLVKFRNKLESWDDYSPRIEFVRDNLGHSCVPSGTGEIIPTGMKLRPGDTLQFVVTATDPQDKEITYGYIPVARRGQAIIWQDENTFSLTVQEEDIGNRFLVQILIKGQSEYHRLRDYDFEVRFEYEVLPARR